MKSLYDLIIAVIGEAAIGLIMVLTAFGVLYAVKSVTTFLD